MNNPEINLPRLWLSLDDIPGQKAAAGYWKRYLGEPTWNAFRSLLFTSDGRKATHYSLPNEFGIEESFRVIEHGTDDFVLVSYDEESPAVPIAGENLLLYQLHWKTLIHLLAKAFQLRPDESLLEVHGVAYCLGQYVPWAGLQIPVYFYHSQESADYLNFLRGRYLQTKMLILVTLTSRWLLEPVRALLRSAGSHPISLEDALLWDKKQWKLSPQAKAMFSSLQQQLKPIEVADPKHPHKPAGQLPVPPGMTWEQIQITSKDGDAIRVQWEGFDRVLTASDMEAVNRKNRKGDRNWQILQLLLANHGKLDRADLYQPKQKVRASHDRSQERRLQLLNKWLMNQWGLSQPPIQKTVHPMNVTYQAKFQVKQESNYFRAKGE